MKIPKFAIALLATSVGVVNGQASWTPPAYSFDCEKLAILAEEQMISGTCMKDPECFAKMRLRVGEVLAADPFYCTGRRLEENPERNLRGAEERMLGSCETCMEDTNNIHWCQFIGACRRRRERNLNAADADPEAKTVKDCYDTFMTISNSFSSGMDTTKAASLTVSVRTEKDPLPDYCIPLLGKGV